jgi:hypothetical protein
MIATLDVCLSVSLRRICAEALVTCFFIDTPKDVEELFRASQQSSNFEDSMWSQGLLCHVRDGASPR